MDPFERVEEECPYCGTTTRVYVCSDMVVCPECKHKYVREPDEDALRALEDDVRRVRPKNQQVRPA